MVCHGGGGTEEAGNKNLVMTGLYQTGAKERGRGKPSAGTQHAPSSNLVGTPPVWFFVSRSARQRLGDLPAEQAPWSLLTWLPEDGAELYGEREQKGGRDPVARGKRQGRDSITS